MSAMDEAYADTVKGMADKVKDLADVISMYATNSRNFGVGLGVYSADNDAEIQDRMRVIQHNIRILSAELDELKHMYGTWHGYRVRDREQK